VGTLLRLTRMEFQLRELLVRHTKGRPLEGDLAL
jgi:hypothetical protein